MRLGPYNRFPSWESANLVPRRWNTIGSASMTPQLGGELLCNPVLAPFGMVAGDAPDEGDVLLRDAGSSERLTS